MPKTPRQSIPLTDEQRHVIGALLLDLQSPARRGTPYAVSQRMTMPKWIAKLAMERAAQLATESGHKRKR